MKNELMILLVIVVLLPGLAVAEEESGVGTSVAEQQVMVRQMMTSGLGEDTAKGLVSAMTSAHFNNDESAQIIGQLRLVQKDHDALTAITGKIHEGIAKQVAPGVVVRAVVRVRERYALAKVTAQGLSTESRGELSAIIADGLVSGLGQEELAQISQRLQLRAQGGEKKRFVPLALETMMAVRDMARYGVQSTTAMAVTTKALSLGYGADEMRLIRQLINDQRMQADMEAISQRMLQGLNQGVRAGELRGFIASAANGSKAGRQGNGSGGSRGGSGSGHSGGSRGGSGHSGGGRGGGGHSGGGGHGGGR